MTDTKLTKAELITELESCRAECVRLQEDKDALTTIGDNLLEEIERLKTPVVVDGVAGKQTAVQKQQHRIFQKMHSDG